MTVVQKFIKLSLPEEKVLFEAVLFLLLAKIVLLILPFRTIVKRISKKELSPKYIEKIVLQKLKTAVYRANKIAFWKNKCLVQTLAVRWMLQRREIQSVLSLGVKQDGNKKLIAHAWIKVGDFEIVNKTDDYKELFSIN